MSELVVDLFSIVMLTAASILNYNNYYSNNSDHTFQTYLLDDNVELAITCTLITIKTQFFYLLNSEDLASAFRLNSKFCIVLALIWFPSIPLVYIVNACKLSYIYDSGRAHECKFAIHYRNVTDVATVVL